MAVSIEWSFATTSLLTPARLLKTPKCVELLTSFSGGRRVLPELLSHCYYKGHDTVCNFVGRDEVDAPYFKCMGRMAPCNMLHAIGRMVYHSHTFKVAPTYVLRNSAAWCITSCIYLDLGEVSS